MIEAAGISKSFVKRETLKNISFKAYQGEIYGLIGYNGVGKTTLMKILSGIYRPDSGEVTAAGQTIYENVDVKKECFFMTEEPPIFSGACMNRMRDFYKGYYPFWDDKVFKGLTDFFELDPTVQVERFSKGMQRQAGLVLAFSSSARYLFLDEAFDGLDETMRKSLSQMIKTYAVRNNAVMIVSSHNLNELEHLADRIGFINNGEMIFDGSLDEIRPLTLEKFFMKGRTVKRFDWDEIYKD